MEGEGDGNLYLPAYDAAALGASLFVLLLYLAIYELHSQLETAGGATQTGRNLQNMVLWAIKHGEKPDAPTVTLAVQSLRNTILVGVFIGGASLQYATVACDVLIRPQGTVPPQLVVREIIIAGLLFMSFLNWSQVVRFANHLGYWVGTMEAYAKVEAKTQTPDFDETNGTIVASHAAEFDTQALREVKLMCSKMGRHFSYGLRFMYLTIPFYFYAAGPSALIVATGLTMGFLIGFDLPQSRQKDNSMSSLGFARTSAD